MLINILLGGAAVLGALPAGFFLMLQQLQGSCIAPFAP
jgi:hypothetical protein